MPYLLSLAALGGLALGLIGCKNEDLTAIDSYKLSRDPIYFDMSKDAYIAKPACTGSMEPTISCDDLLVIYKPDISDMKVGDIIQFRTPREVTLKS